MTVNTTPYPAYGGPRAAKNLRQRADDYPVRSQGLLPVHVQARGEKHRPADVEAARAPAHLRDAGLGVGRIRHVRAVAADGARVCGDHRQGLRAPPEEGLRRGTSSVLGVRHRGHSTARRPQGGPPVGRCDDELDRRSPALRRAADRRDDRTDRAKPARATQAAPHQGLRRSSP